MSIKQEPGTVTENVTEVEHDSSDNRDGKTVNKNSLLPEEDSALPKSIKSNGLWLKPDIRDEVSTGSLGDSRSQKGSSQTGDQTEMESDYNDRDVMINNTDCLPYVKTECLHEEDGPVLNLMKSSEQSLNISTPDIRERMKIADASSSKEGSCDNSDPLQKTKGMCNLQASYAYVTGRHCENQVKKRKCRENDVELKRSSLHHIIASKIACKLEKVKESQTAPGNSLVNDIDEHQSSEQRDSPAGKKNACNQGEYACGELLKLKQPKGKHIGTKQFSCDYCDYTCSHSSHFKVHQRKHTGDKPYSCDVCDFTCAQSSSLKRHKQRHTGEKPYSCDLCDYTCAQSSHLKEHKQKHTGEEPYSCDLCDYTCAQSSSLRVHIRKHTGEKPYSCEFCDYTCAQSSHLKVHERKHTGEKPYSCDLCDFTCAQSSHLKAHKRTHTGEKPYSCDLCNFTCAQSSSLIAHKVKHTGDIPCS